MPSKQVTDRQKNTNAVNALLAEEGNAQALAQGIEDFLTPYLAPGETMPDFSFILTLIGRALSQSMEALVQADQTHTAELADDGPILNARDEKKEELYSHMVSFRETLTGVFGASALAPLGFSRGTPADPVVLVQFTRQVVDAIRKGPLPPPKDEDISYNPTRNVDKAEKMAEELEDLIKSVAREKREAEQTQEAKNQAMAKNDDVFRRACSFLVGAFLLAGMPALAKKVRPSTRRPGRLISDQEADTTSEEASTQAGEGESKAASTGVGVSKGER